MTSEWRSYRLDEVGRIVTGKTPRSGNPEFFNGLVPFVTPPDFAGQKWIRKTSRTLSETGALSVKGSIVPPRSVLVTCIGSDMGKAAISSARCVTNQQVNALLIDETRFLPEFLYYKLSLRKEEIRSLAGGSAQPIMNKSAFGALRVECPSLGDQARIVELLRPIDDLITLLRETNATLEAIVGALFKSWFVDFDPVLAKQQGLVLTGTGDAAAALFPNGTETSALGLIPRRWQVQAVGDVVACVGGATPDTKELSYWEPEEHAWTTPKDLSGLLAPVLLTTERRLSTKGLARIGSGLLPEGTLLMSSRAPIGYLAITRMPVAINQGYIAMTPGSRLPPLYMLYWCRHNMEGIKARANGSTFMEISKKAFRPIPILFPPADVVDAFMTTASPLFDRLVENARQEQTLAALRDTLLPRLVSGQLRLPEAEASLTKP